MMKLMAMKEKKDKSGFDEYELEGWCRTLLEAEEIKGDKKKMAALAPYLDKKHKAIGSLADLKALGNKKFREEKETDGETV